MSIGRRLGMIMGPGTKGAKVAKSPSSPQRASTAPADKNPIEVGSVVHLQFELGECGPRGSKADSSGCPSSIHITGSYKNSDERMIATYRFYHYPSWP